MLLARRWFYRLYLGRYVALRPASPEDLTAWDLPVAAARLSEGIAEEEVSLLAIVQAAVRR